MIGRRSLVMTITLLVLGAVPLAMVVAAKGIPRQIPPMLRELNCNPRGYDGVNCRERGASNFSRVLQQRYPIGSDAAVMIRDLRAMGFSYPGPQRCEIPPPAKVGELLKGHGLPLCPIWANRGASLNQAIFAFHPLSLFDCSGATVLWAADQHRKITYVTGGNGGGAGCSWP